LLLLVTMAAKLLSTFLAVLAKMCFTSRQVSSGLASSMRAMTPDTVGAAEDVPLKVEV